MDASTLSVIAVGLSAFAVGLNLGIMVGKAAAKEQADAALSERKPK